MLQTGCKSRRRRRPSGTAPSRAYPFSLYHGVDFIATSYCLWHMYALGMHVWWTLVALYVATLCTQHFCNFTSVLYNIDKLCRQT
ncbi:hypothetical protein DEU56DRAFT_148474 [Suillus clintonianus]|uniref:uncharacterized protein n=1 Tax=Suillus clintonianus TaxID=1904413 RepID=UPI001B8756B3|nr:uncharacterized protein DEU56DRAFT_148474 [Suillus clintonianus]KAG2146648.1 hypothetical protein DEU56DRAFT_148474 [Suillus clintonianus]